MLDKPIVSKMNERIARMEKSSELIMKRVASSDEISKEHFTHYANKVASMENELVKIYAAVRAELGTRKGLITASTTVETESSMNELLSSVVSLAARLDLLKTIAADEGGLIDKDKLAEEVKEGVETGLEDAKEETTASVETEATETVDAHLNIMTEDPVTAEGMLEGSDTTSTGIGTTTDGLDLPPEAKELGEGNSEPFGDTLDGGSDMFDTSGGDLGGSADFGGGGGSPSNGDAAMDQADYDFGGGVPSGEGEGNESEISFGDEPAAPPAPAPVQNNLPQAASVKSAASKAEEIKNKIAVKRTIASQKTVNANPSLDSLFDFMPKR